MGHFRERATPILFLIILAFVPSTAICEQAASPDSDEASIVGSVVDSSGGAIAHAQVKLFLDAGAPPQQTSSSDNGEFSFSSLKPGRYQLTISAPGFAEKTTSGEIHAAEALELSGITLAVDELATEVNVTQTQVEIAEAQIKVEETQRLLGVVPNFFVSYDHDAVPLTVRQKLELTGKTWFDPSAFIINGIIAGIWQADNTHKGFGQGGVGYAKRYGAAFGDYGTSLLIQNVVLPTIFKQDPRYFYKGTGTTRSRFFYAVSRTFICRGDNTKDQFCYSSFVNRVGTGFATNYFYPAADRDKPGAILRDSAIGVGIDALGNLFQEFLARRITKKKP